MEARTFWRAKWLRLECDCIPGRMTLGDKVNDDACGEEEGGRGNAGARS